MVWYVLLTSCLIFASFRVARRVFFGQLTQQVYAALDQEIERFDSFVDEAEKHRLHWRKKGIIIDQTSSTGMAVLFDEFLEEYVPRDNIYFITMLDGQLYRASTDTLPVLLRVRPDLLATWASQSESPSPQIFKQDGYKVMMAIQPVGKNPDLGAVAIAIHDTTTDFRRYKRMATFVFQLAIALFLGFSVLAWVTAGRVLAPLRSLSKTAQSITESDMSGRIAVQGKDEIAELAKTFNAMLDRLERAFASQQAFLNDAGHELRTPITVIQGHLEVLKLKPERLPRTIELVTDELSRMNRLVNDLLLLAKAERPDFLRLQVEELDWLTEELYLKAQAIAPRRWQLEAKAPTTILVDRQRLTQAVMNLLANAVRHTKESDTIALGSSLRDDYAYIWVRDTGEGIALEDQARIFDRFTRATHADRYSEGEGAGLGLSIVQAIAQAHGGWITLESAPSKGATFTLVLPLLSMLRTAYESHSHRRGQPPHHGVFGSRATGAWLHHPGDSER
ncbi:MAG: HAMP domain-containing histidine kinase [Coleofasciculaceae cyanobacterium SM2_3_26]|nr:HAMP domain-containing histidine kinase [Coleofasciculaceae cyanobacterium SM2_3_26]